MKIAQAVDILKPLGNDMKSLKTAYRAAARKYHPDFAGAASTVMMQLINEAFETLKKWIGDFRPFASSQAESEQKQAETHQAGKVHLDEEIYNQYMRVRNCTGLVVELCGTWLWIGGETKVHRVKLREEGFKWSKNKVKWFWHPKGYRKRTDYVWTMDQIRNSFGSQDLEVEQPSGSLG